MFDENLSLNLNHHKNPIANTQEEANRIFIKRNAERNRLLIHNDIVSGIIENYLRYFGERQREREGYGNYKKYICNDCTLHQ